MTHTPTPTKKNAKKLDLLSWVAGGPLIVPEQYGRGRKVIITHSKCKDEKKEDAATAEGEKKEGGKKDEVKEEEKKDEEKKNEEKKDEGKKDDEKKDEEKKEGEKKGVEVRIYKFSFVWRLQMSHYILSLSVVIPIYSSPQHSSI
jgi:negative regulator of genetic competence, sporulation and motility